MTTWRYDIVRRIAGPGALSQRVFLPVLIVLSAGTALSEAGVDPTAVTAWNSVTLVAFCGAWIISLALGIVGNLFFHTRSSARFAAVVFAYFVVESTRAVLIAWQAAEFGLDDAPNWAYRVVAGGFTGLALFGVVGFVVDETASYRERLGALVTSARQLEELVSATETDLEVRRVQLLDTVRAGITEAIREVLSAGGSSARDVANELVRISNDVVRPLSHSLIPTADSLSGSTDGGPPSEPDRVSFRSVLNYATYVEPFRPEAVVSMGAMLSLGAVIFFFPLDGQLAVAVSLVWVFAYLWLMRRFLQPQLRRMGVASRIVTLVVVYSGLAVVPALLLANTPALADFARLSLFVYVVLVAQVVLWPLAVIAGLRRARADVIADLRTANERLVWQRARLSLYLWGHQNVVAVALHKEVQGTLMAAAMKLKMSRDAGKNDVESIEDIRATVLTAAEFVTTPVEALPMRAAIDAVNERWAGVFTITLSSSETTSEGIRRLDTDALARRIAIDLLAECVTNAVKHGQATHAEVSLTMVDDDVLRIETVNNGRPVSGDPDFGLGARMLLAVSTDRGFENQAQGVRIWADIPVV